MNFFELISTIFLFNFIIFNGARAKEKCTDLLPGQYLCSPPVIDPFTQQPTNCDKENLAFGR